MRSFTFASVTLLLASVAQSQAAAAPAADTPVIPYAPYVMTQIDKLHAKGFTGKGIKIAIVGSGVDYKHKAFGGCFGQGCVVSGGYDFVGDNWNTTNEPEPKADPLESLKEGRGTRQVSTISAQATDLFNFTGVAPGAEILVYKVASLFYGSKPEIVAKAIDRAVNDGANIIVASTETLFINYNKRPVIEAVTRATESGIVVLDGIEGSSIIREMVKPFSIDAVSATKGVEAVGKFGTNANLVLLSRGFSQIGNDTTQKYPFDYQRINQYSTDDKIDLPLYDIGVDACTTLPDSVPDLSGYISLVKVGGCSIFTKQGNLRPKRGDGKVLFYTTDSGTYASDREDSGGQLAGFVNGKLGQQWVQQLKNGTNIRLSIDPPIKESYSIGAGEPYNFVGANYGGAAVGYYSGPSQSLEIKPIYGVPSESGIMAKWNGSYEVSYYGANSNPMVAGAYALIAQVRGIKPTPDNIQTLLANTAKAQLYHDGKGFVPGVLASVAHQGAGIIQVYDAAYVKASVTPISIPFNDTDHAIKEAELSLINHNTVAVTYALNSIGAKTLYLLQNENKPATDAVVTVALDKKSVTLQPGESAKIKVTPPATINLPNAEKLPVWSGYVTINGTDGTNLSVPYLGVQGSLYKLEPFQFAPVIRVGGRQRALPENSTIYLGPGGTDELYAYAYAALGSPIFEAYLQSVDQDGKPDGKLDSLMPQGPFQAVGLNDKVKARMSYWDGKLANGEQAPEGRYRVRFRGLRLFGDISKDQDWQTLSSQYFNMKYTDDGDGNEIKL